MNFCHLAALVALSLALHALPASAAPDWLIEPAPFRARVTKSRDGRELELNNGLLRRVIRIEPNAATVALDNLASGELVRRREFRLREELREIVARRLEQRARELATGDRWNELQAAVFDRTLDPWAAADEMLRTVGA